MSGDVQGGEGMRVIHVTTATNKDAAGVRAAVDGMVDGLSRVRDMHVVQMGVVPEGESWELGVSDRVRRVQLRSVGPRLFSYTRRGPRDHPDRSSCSVPTGCCRHGPWRITHRRSISPGSPISEPR
jgi:hypothetical protein